MAKDSALLLHNAAVTANSSSTAINIDGGQPLVVEIRSTVTPTDADETIAIKFQVSVDGGTDYIDVCTFPTFVKAADKGNAGTWVAMMGFVPRANDNPDARGVNTQVKARLNFVVAGTTPSFTIRANITHMSGVPFGSNAGSTSGVQGRYGPLDAIKAWG